jgi:hypothetical protein
MNLYLDDDSAKASLVKLLRAAGHQVVIPADASLAGVSDPRHLTHTVQQKLVLLTRNHDDYETSTCSYRGRAGTIPESS